MKAPEIKVDLVSSVSDEVREFPAKDASGTPTSTMIKHRIVTIVGISDNAPVTFGGFDLPSTFKLPAEGKPWTSPPVRSIDFSRGFPECRL